MDGVGVVGRDSLCSESFGLSGGEIDIKLWTLNHVC
jgi:hypothetical protein